MRKLACLVVVAVLVAPAALLAQGFEGVIRQEVKSVLPQGVAALAGGDTADAGKVLHAVVAKLGSGDTASVVSALATIHVKGQRLRTDGGALAVQGAPDGYAILDAAKATVYTVLPSRKTVGFATVEGMAEVQRRLEAEAPARQSPPTIGDLGMKQVNGTQAHGYLLTTPEGAAIVWVDPALKGTLDAFEALQRKLAGSSAGSLQQAVSELGFPVLQQVVVKAPPMLGSGWLFSQLSVSSVRREPVADTEFVIPADYTQVDLAKRLRGEQ